MAVSYLGMDGCMYVWYIYDILVKKGGEGIWCWFCPLFSFFFLSFSLPFCPILLFSFIFIIITMIFFFWERGSFHLVSVSRLTQSLFCTKDPKEEKREIRNMGWNKDWFWAWSTPHPPSRDRTGSLGCIMALNYMAGGDHALLLPFYKV